MLKCHLFPRPPEKACPPACLQNFLEALEQHLFQDVSGKRGHFVPECHLPPLLIPLQGCAKMLVPGCKKASAQLHWSHLPDQIVLAAVCGCPSNTYVTPGCSFPLPVTLLCEKLVSHGLTRFGKSSYKYDMFIFLTKNISCLRSSWHVFSRLTPPLPPSLSPFLAPSLFLHLSPSHICGEHFHMFGGQIATFVEGKLPHFGGQIATFVEGKLPNF